MIFRDSDKDTIAAIATACGEGGVGIVRVSGKEAIAVADRMFEARSGVPARDQKSFTARYGHVVSRKPSQGSADVVDEALLLVMRAPKSFTAEDTAEFQVHGGTVVLQEVLALAVREGARLALPGEFTKRAFLNGRIDLLQAEATLDLIQAKTETTRRWASAQLDGVLSKKIGDLKGSLLEALSHLEASIDFPEDDLSPADFSSLEKKLSSLESVLGDLLGGSALGLLAKRGMRVALWGRPNTGKSSLMNRLVRHNRVIVTPVPGTTRDVVEEEIQIEGFPVRLFDTAGIQETNDVIEKEGVARSRKAVTGADLVLFVVDASVPLKPEDEILFREIEMLSKIFVLNKSDLPKKIDVSKWVPGQTKIVETSCETGEGIPSLEKGIFEWAIQGKAGTAGESVVSSVRQKDVLEKMAAALRAAREACAERRSPELIAVDVRLALEQLGILVGEIFTDDLLDVLFSRFCIGK